MSWNLMFRDYETGGLIRDFFHNATFVPPMINQLECINGKHYEVMSVINYREQQRTIILVLHRPELDK